MKTYLLGLGLLFSMSNAFAQGGSHAGNGGNIIHLNNGYYLLDFAEAGIETAPVISNLQIDTQTSTVLQSKFPQYPLLRLTVGRKLAELHSSYPVIADVALDVIKKYIWAFVPAPLEVIHDARTHLRFPNAPLLQGAVRDAYRVQITRAAFERLDPANQAGLIFHEIFYAMSDNQQNSDKVRLLNGILFASTASSINVDTFNLAMNDANFGSLQYGPDLMKVKKQKIHFASSEWRIYGDIYIVDQEGNEVTDANINLRGFRSGQILYSTNLERASDFLKERCEKLSKSSALPAGFELSLDLTMNVNSNFSSGLEKSEGQYRYKISDGIKADQTMFFQKIVISAKTTQEKCVAEATTAIQVYQKFLQSTLEKP